MFTGRQKIVKANGAEPDEFEASVAQELFNLEVTTTIGEGDIGKTRWIMIIEATTDYIIAATTDYTIAVKLGCIIIAESDYIFPAKCVILLLMLSRPFPNW